MMNKLLLGFFCILAFFAVFGHALECYYCLSTNSWDACDSGKTKVKCNYDAVGCLKMYTRSKYNSVDKAYAKGCAKTCGKERIPACNAGGNLDCHLNCCDTDYCNAGSSLSASLPFMLFSAAGALVVALGKIV